ncbi:TylF/MycF/NovP-related O-methyltransferase [Minwuia sp.]|uniref:TylF/MycF/NovP-related O-methyltransferase n=1 Tax=Minwuia sp. TaxID=2493630 RepID=UPI003A8D948E
MARQPLKKLALRYGYDFTFRKLPQHALRNRQIKLPRDVEPEFAEIFEQVGDYTMTTPDCVYALFNATRHIVQQDIPGDFVECGVWRGGSAMTMALTLKLFGVTDRRIWLYDTFAGMVKPEEIDVRQRDGSDTIKRWEMQQKDDHNAWAYAPLDEVKRNMDATGYPARNIDYIQGTVEETIPQTMPEKIAMLRLDTDWYRSTLHELNHLYPVLSSNGFLIIDDYGAYEGARQATDQYFDEQGNRPFLNRIDTAARIAVKPA